MAASIRLDSAAEQRLDHFAAVTGRTKAYYLSELIANGLDDLEDDYLAGATMKACVRARSRATTHKK